MNALGEALGALCKAVLPIPDGSFCGDPASPVAVCTLSSMGLLREIRGSDVLGLVRIAGRLLSENRGIDEVLGYLYGNPGVRTLVVCGRDAAGHRAGHSLLALHAAGADAGGRIAGSHSPDPFVTAPGEWIAHFGRNVRLVDMTGETRLGAVRDAVLSLQ